MAKSAAGQIVLRDVAKSFMVDGVGFPALEGIDLVIAPGAFVTVIGASGCGKSTLLRLIAGLETADAGTITHDGVAVTGPSLARGIVFQEPRLFPWLTVAGNIALGLVNSGYDRKTRRDLVAEHIALVGLERFANAWPHQLSGGMAQRAAIARGLVSRPGVLLLDEPFGALDALTRARLQQELLRIWGHERPTMILVTHDVDEAAYLGDQVVVMEANPGRITRIVPVELPHPRSRAHPALVRRRAELLALLDGPAEDDTPTDDAPHSEPSPRWFGYREGSPADAHSLQT